MKRWLRGIVLAVLVGLLAPPGALFAQRWEPTHPASSSRGLSSPPVVSAFEGFDAFVDSLMQEFGVPGVAVAAIQDGEVVLAKGYGYRDREKGLPMTERTLLAIGSNSKSFTVTVLGMLVDEGRLEWDEPLRSYLPDFQLADERATYEMTPRDLVTHRSGLPRHDLLWYGRSYGRYDLYERLRYLEPSTTFRGRWQYQNLMFLTAGILAERLTGRTWEDLVRERIFEPLGMARSNLSVEDSRRTDDHALPYAWIEGEVVRVPFRNIDAVGPAGSINSSVEEMIRYVQMHIDGGVFGGDTLISAEVSAEMQRPHSTVPGEIEYPELGYASYGLGLMVSAYRGWKVVSHGGGIDGFISAMAWMPRKRIGVVVLTNLSGFNPVPTVVQWNVFDRLLGVEPADWFARAKEQRRKAEEAREKRRREREENRKAGTTPSHPLADYAGRYEHPGYGLLEVTVEDGGLVLTLDRFRGRLEHYHYDIFELEAPPQAVPLDGMLVTFGYDRKGVVDRVTIPLEPAVDDIVFRRVDGGDGGR